MMNEDKSIQIVVSIVHASNWTPYEPVWTVRLGLHEIAGISQRETGKLGYTLWGGPSKEEFDDRLSASFAAIRHHLQKETT